MPFLADLISNTFKVKVCLYSTSLCGTEELDVVYYSNSYTKEIHLLNLLNRNTFISIDLDYNTANQYERNVDMEEDVT